MSLSGCVLVFHDEIDSTLFRDHITLPEPVAHTHFDASFENIRRAYPGWEIRIPSLRENTRETLRYELRKGTLRKWIFVHPQSGEILSRAENAHERLVNVLLTFHYSFFAGTFGKAVVLFVGVSFLILLVTGVILYRRSILRVFTLRQKISLRNRNAFFSSIHRVLGVWGLLFNILICITGIRIAYVVFTSALATGPQEIRVPAIDRSVDDLIAGVYDAYPDFVVTYLRFPVTEGGTLLLLGHLHSDPSWYGRHYSSIAVNYVSGKAEGVALLKDKPPMDRFLTILQPLHFGDYAGMAVKIIYAVGGLLPGILAVSGFFIWRRRTRELRRTTRQKPKANRQKLTPDTQHPNSSLSTPPAAPYTTAPAPGDRT